ncbi:Asp23/Gls24 family envelope stress response protein [Nocardia carnea]|uniref:Asp23/Gls24 family envelope stress response protein n=1 Tax=Nocardia carnea TaxID=37328 RepID=UPI0024589870|nr:Asp23/Gls24 family envelope stress response protein [Nocardia carnea]
MTSGKLSMVVAPPVIAAVAARAATGTPGVARLEPGVRGLLAVLTRAGRQRWTDADPAPTEGVRVRVTGAGLIVHVDIAVRSKGPAAEVGRAVQEQVAREVDEQTGQPVDAVYVHILDIEPEL